jgi:hypothetical protein
MKPKKFVTLGLLLILLALTATAVLASGMNDVVAVRLATIPFRDPEAAQAAGYDLVPGLDHCFNNPGVGAMGYHYIDVSALDAIVEPTHPEAMVYAPLPTGALKLGAVEYIVPVSAWEATGSADLPSLFGQQFHLNEALGVYVLHVWLWIPNPLGLFEDWNPRVSCP